MKKWLCCTQMGIWGQRGIETNKTNPLNGLIYPFLSYKYTTPSVFSWYPPQNSLYLLPPPKRTTQAHPSRLLYTSNISLSIIQYFHRFTCCTCRRIHVPHTDSKNAALLQFIELLAFTDTTLCICRLLCGRRSRISHLLFVVGMWRHYIIMASKNQTCSTRVRT